jgi:CHAT domain-containing protein
MSQRGELASFEYLHFATHAILGREGLGIGQPALVLAQTGDTGEDGFLTMSEVAELKIGAKMVVLSACDTGLGEDVPGEGLVGLARAFLFAGARSLVVSLWGVGDSTTALLMDRFYAGILESGLSPAKALRQARLEVLSRHPFHWGGFVLVGEP